MRLILGGVCFFFVASVCRAEFTFQGISRGVFGVTNIVDNRFVATGSVGNAFGQQDSFITPSVAWVYSSVDERFPSWIRFVLSVLSVGNPTNRCTVDARRIIRIRSAPTCPPDRRRFK